MIGFTLDEAFNVVGFLNYPRAVFKQCFIQEHRIYSTLDHVQGMLNLVPRTHPEVEIIVDAILFHDIVKLPYMTPKGLNESLSIAEYLFYNQKTLAFETPFGLSGDGSLEYEKRVIEAIAATSRHDEDQEHLTDVSKCVLDLDLYMFSLPYDDYLSLRIKKEEEDKIIYGEQSKQRMYMFLKKLLKRNSLYYCHDDWTSQAMSNIKKDVKYNFN